MKKFTRVSECLIMKLKEQSDDEVYVDDMNHIDKIFKDKYPGTHIESSWFQRGILSGDVVVHHGCLVFADEILSTDV